MKHCPQEPPALPLINPWYQEKKSWRIPLEQAICLLPNEPPPLGAENQFNTDFNKHTVPYQEILSGGPPKDGIPAIDNPIFISVDEASAYLEDIEPVVFLQIGNDARAYPIQILTWHEIINDVVDGKPVVVTFCPLCNTAIAFDATFDDQVLDFGTTGPDPSSAILC